jgi:hypothetical protein
MLGYFVKSLQEKAVSAENKTSDDTIAYWLNNWPEVLSPRYILSSRCRRAGFHFGRSIWFVSQSSSISNIMHFGISSAISSQDLYKWVDMPWGVIRVAQDISISQSIPTQTARRIFRSSRRRYSRLTTFYFGYSPRGGSSSRTRPTITSADDPSSHWFC